MVNNVSSGCCIGKAGGPESLTDKGVVLKPKVEKGVELVPESHEFDNGDAFTPIFNSLTGSGAMEASDHDELINGSVTERGVLLLFFINDAEVVTTATV